MPPSNKHFNMANAFGRIVEVKSSKVRKEGEPDDKGIQVADLTLDCHSTLYGKPRAFIRFWGQKAVDFLRFHKSKDIEVLKVKGILQQFMKEGAVIPSSSMTGFEWEIRNEETPRMGFVLVGTVDGLKDGPDKEKILQLKVEREISESKKVTENFTLFLHPDDLKKVKVKAPVYCSTVHIEGLLCQMGELNFISDERGGDVKPYIKELKNAGN